MDLSLIGYVQLTGDESEFASVSFSFFLCVTVEVEVEVMSCHSVVSIIFLRKGEFSSSPLSSSLFFIVNHCSL